MATPFTVYKLIILYMLRNSSSPITNSEISEFILDHEYTNYFHLQQALSELEETELIEKRTISNTSYYYLTEDGKNTLTYFENDISQDIRTEVLQYLAATRCLHQESGESSQPIITLIIRENMWFTFSFCRRVLL